MLAGGGEELCPTEAVVFDTLFATSTKTRRPNSRRAPLMRIVMASSLAKAPALVLEELEHAKARGAKIYAELVGFGTNSDGQHVTQPNAPRPWKSPSD